MKAFRLSKVGGDEREYDVEELAGGARCDCADFVFRREGVPGLGCRHIRGAWMCGLIGEYSTPRTKCDNGRRSRPVTSSPLCGRVALGDTFSRIRVR